MSAGLTERVFQTRVLDLCRWLRLQWHHETDSRKSRAGFPDLVVCGPGGLVFAELKTDAGRVRPEQQAWLDALRAAGQRAELWRPQDWSAIEQTLRGLAHPDDARHVP